MARQESETSITLSEAKRFLESADVRDALYCKMKPGLHLLKTKTGGSWRYRYRNAANQRRTVTVARFHEMKPQQVAEKVMRWRVDGTDPLEEQRNKHRAALTEQEAAKARTLGEYLNKGYQRHGSQETLAILRNNFSDWLDRDMATLRKADVQVWQDKREKEGKEYATLVRAYGALRTLLKRACEEDGLLSDNPLERVRLGKEKRTARSEELRRKRESARRLLTSEELASLKHGLDAFAEEIRRKRRNSRKHGKDYLPDLDSVAHPHWFIPFCHAALYTGLRPGDLYTLTWQELNVTFGRLIKTPNKTLHNPDPARVVMDLPPQAIAPLCDWWKQQGEPETGLVFPSRRTEWRMDKHAHDSPFNRVKRLGGLPDDLVFYSLRHHFISTLVSAGVPLLTVAQLSGHKSATMIERHYGHLCPVAARDIMAQYGQAIESAQKVAG